MRESGVDLGTIGLFALVGTPLHAEISLGAAGRCAASAVLHAHFRPPARLAGVFATGADRSDPAAGADRPGALAAVRRARRAAGGGDVLDAGHRGRCLSRREPARERAGRRHGVLCRGLPCRHAGLDRRRAVSGERFRRHRHPALIRLDVGLCDDGGHGADRHRHRARRHRARAIGACRGRDQHRDRVRARDPCRGRRILGISGPKRCARGARLRGAVQIHRRILRHHDRAVRDRPRLFPQRLCRHRQGRRPRRDPDRRLRRRICRAALLAGREPVDRRRAAGGRQSVVLLARARRRQSMGAGALRSRRKISPAPSAP